MKKQICLICLISLMFVRPVWADPATPSAAQDLLNRVATKVAELSQKLQKGYVGKIKSLGVTSIVTTVSDKDRTIYTNDATSFFRIRAGSRSEVNFSALKIGDDIAALGTIDPTTFDLTARQVIAKIKRTNLVGKITAADKSILTVDETKIDISDVVLKTASSSGKISSAKLANFKEGATIFAIIHSPDEKTGIYSVLKALVLSPQ